MSLSLYFHSLNTLCIFPLSLLFPFAPHPWLPRILSITHLTCCSPTPPTSISVSVLRPRANAWSSMKQPTRNPSPPQNPLDLNFHVVFSLPLITFWVVTFCRTKSAFVFVFFFFNQSNIMQDLSSQGSDPCPLQWKCRVLTTGPPGKSQSLWFFCNRPEGFLQSSSHCSWS